LKDKKGKRRADEQKLTREYETAIRVILKQFSIY